MYKVSIGIMNHLVVLISSMNFNHQMRHFLPKCDDNFNLEKMGHELMPVKNLGVLMGIVIDSENNVLIGASDSSSPDGAAIGY